MNKVAMIAGGVLAGVAAEKLWRHLEETDGERANAVKRKLNDAIRVIERYEDLDLNKPLVFVRKIMSSGMKSNVVAFTKWRANSEPLYWEKMHQKRGGEHVYSQAHSFYAEGKQSIFADICRVYVKNMQKNDARMKPLGEMSRVGFYGFIIEVNEHLTLLCHSDFEKPDEMYHLIVDAVLFSKKTEIQAGLLWEVIRNLWADIDMTLRLMVAVEHQEDSPGRYVCYSHFEESAPASYSGSANEHQKLWLKMLADRQRHHVLLYGKPGCGKTTLIKSMTWKHKLRTVYVQALHIDIQLPSALSSCADLVVIEDIERLVGDERISQLLSLLEHEPASKCPGFAPPLVIMTANDPSKLPEAIGRCGRIDQIVLVESGGQEERQAQIELIASRFGFDVKTLPQRHVDEMHKILMRQTPAFVEQYIARVARWGVDYDILNGDVTFAVPFVWSDEDSIKKR